MNHPTKEDLISFLYDETSPEKKSELNAHLQTCADCRAQISEWQKIKGELGAWKIPATAKRPFIFAKAMKWAAAAVFMLTVGFAFGRFHAPQVDAKKLQDEIEARLEQNVQQKIKTAREAQRKEFIAMLRDVEEQRLSDYSQLRKDLETVAVVADQKLTTTERALNQLNLVAQSENNPSTK